MPVVRKSLVRTTELPGKVAPMEETPIVAKIAGYVETVKKDIGDKVTKGETLAVLHALNYRKTWSRRARRSGSIESSRPRRG